MKTIWLVLNIPEFYRGKINGTYRAKNEWRATKKNLNVKERKRRTLKCRINQMNLILLVMVDKW